MQSQIQGQILLKSIIKFIEVISLTEFKYIKDPEKVKVIEMELIYQLKRIADALEVKNGDRENFAG